MAHALVHILGSRAGYTTLDASSGVTAVERSELEVLSFGDATSGDAMARLETSAAIIGRRLRSGRFAISRMLPGGTDDAGRPTIEVVSLVLDQRAYTAMIGSIGMLADDVRFWRLARSAVARGYELPETDCAILANDPRAMRAFDGWIAARKQGGIAVLSAADAPGLLAMVARLDTIDLAECRWGVGVLSLSAPVDVCTIAPATAAIGPRPVLRVSAGGPWVSPEMEHVAWHLERNPLFPPTASLVSAVRIKPALDEPARAEYAATATTAATPISRAHSPRLAPRPRNLTQIAGISAVASLALLAVMATLYARSGRGSTTVKIEPKASEEGVDGTGSETPKAAMPEADADPGAGYGGIAPVAPPAPAPTPPAPAPTPAPTTTPAPTPTAAPTPAPTPEPAPTTPPPTTPAPAPTPAGPAPAANDLWQNRLNDFTTSLETGTKTFKDLRQIKPENGEKSDAFAARIHTAAFNSARENAKHTAEALLEILALDKARKLDAASAAASDPQILNELLSYRNGFVILFSRKENDRIPALACPKLGDCWLAFLKAAKSQLELINSDQLRNAWNAGLGDYLAKLDLLDPKSTRDLKAVKGGVTKFLQFDGKNLPPDLVLEIEKQEKAQEKAKADP